MVQTYRQAFRKRYTLEFYAKEAAMVVEKNSEIRLVAGGNGHTNPL
jgi:hypothetical protein